MSESIISQDNIKIEGIQYVNLLGLEIDTAVNQHGRAKIHVELLESNADSFLERADESVTVSIKTDAPEQQNQTLFCGYVDRVEVSKQFTHTEMIVELASFSKKLDIDRFDKTYQVDSMKFKEIMEKSAEEVEGVKTEIKMHADDRANGDWVIQYHETAWEFIKLEATKCKACIFTNVLDEKNAVISVGVPSASEFGKAIKEETKEYSNIADVHAPGKGAAIQLKTFLYGIAGTKFTVNKEPYIIADSHCELATEGLRCTYICKREECFVCKEEWHKGLAGHMFTCTVKDVESDTLKLEFTQFQEKYDSATTKKFQYSTTYASSDGSGLYLMPEKEDIVRVFCPTNDERDAFASSSVNTNPLEKPRNKNWKAPGGKEILLTDDGIYIICEKEKVFINLTSADGIDIFSKNPIKITSEKDIQLKADGKIELKAGKKINAQVGKSGIEMTDKKVFIGGDAVYIN